MKPRARIYDEAWKQFRLARYRVPAEQMLDMYVDPAEGHDDFLISIALCCEAIHEWSAPPIESHIIRPLRLYEGESRF